ncbi:DUF7345 domain-containing protein [Haloplanus salilacus]|uniref:DUF7345 domain-containing protein n=1 Tax=Haloplanus salilacus TaxID=2949994 RepID=UPI0030CE020F
MRERSSNARIAVVVAALILSVTVGSIGGAAAAGTTSTHAQLGGGPLFQQGVDTDSVRLSVGVEENGSASWTVEYWTRLDDENTTEAFESLRSDIESNPSNFSDPFAARMESTVATAENSTGREMNATDFGVRAETRAPPEYGVVVYTFRWDGFAAVDGDRLRVGDAIEGFFLDDRTRLTVEWPADYTATRIAPDPDERRSNAVVWRGEATSFVSGEPTIVLDSDAAATTEAGTGGGGSGGEDGGPTTASPDDSGSPLPILGVGVGLLVILGIGAWWFRDRLPLPVGDGDGAGGSPATDPAESADDGAPAAGADAGAAAAADDGRDTQDTREDLLSNEERVLQFVREQGGRVKQQEIVEAFDWTEARTSQIVRDLRDDGSLEGFRLGRENVLKLPDEE